MAYRLGLDLGTNSIGWVLLEKNDDGTFKEIKNIGVRIFPDGRKPKERTSLAVDRRMARQMRRRRDRYIKRQRRLLNALVQHGLMPVEPEARSSFKTVDPYDIRKKGLDEPLSPYELGRAIFHLNQRRGFKSNRKADKGESEAGKVKSAISNTRQAIKNSNCRTFGEWLYLRKQNGEAVRGRPVGSGAKSTYELYADRALIEEELNILWKAQYKLGLKECTDAALRTIKDVMLHQRPLKPVHPGKCTLEPDKPRAPLASPIVQQFRIYQELNNIRLISPDLSERPLSKEERDKLASFLEENKELKLEKLCHKIGLDDTFIVNLQSETRGILNGNVTTWKLKNKKLLTDAWTTLSLQDQHQWVYRLENDIDEEILIKDLQQSFPIDKKAAITVANTLLPQGYGRLSLDAINKILPHLKNDVITFDKAANLAGYNHSDLSTGEIFERLPYYGQVLERYTGAPNEASNNVDEAKYGRIANPTVHIALNQLRKVVNALLESHGYIDEIVVEVTRDLKVSEKKRREIISEQEKNQKTNMRFAQELESLGLPNNYENRLRLRLWEELNSEDPLNRRCPYTGEQISKTLLFSDRIEIEHIIPFSLSLDDTLANKTLCFRKANREKGERTPFEAFASNSGYIWSEILDRADRLPFSKFKRFAQDARETFAAEDKWLARQLNDSAYIARVAREYLSAICHRDKVWVTPGKLTGLFRHALGLNNILSDSGKKERSDHRHHAIDATVIALTDKGLLQTAANHSRWAKEKQLSRLLEAFPEPWSGFRQELEKKISVLVVSHKPDHGPEAALHNDTAYGIVDGPDSKGVFTVVSRKPLQDLKRDKIDAIRDAHIRERLHQFLEAHPDLSEREAFRIFSEQQGIYRVRLLDKLSVIPIYDNKSDETDNSVPYKAYKGDGNYCYEIWQDDSGKWDGRVISTFEANQPPYNAFRQNTKSFLHTSFCGRSLIMRLIPNDIVMIENNDRNELMRIQRISTGIITLSPLNETNVDARNRDKNDEFRFIYKSPDSLRKAKGRRIFVDILGKVKDPGFKYAGESSRGGA